MHKYLIKLITYFALLFAASSNSYSQSSFNTVLDKDSVYRYNTVLNSIGTAEAATEDAIEHSADITQSRETLLERRTAV